jgi:hypothetical protein
VPCHFRVIPTRCGTDSKKNRSDGRPVPSLLSHLAATQLRSYSCYLALSEAKRTGQQQSRSSDWLRLSSGLSGSLPTRPLQYSDWILDTGVFFTRSPRFLDPTVAVWICLDWLLCFGCTQGFTADCCALAKRPRSFPRDCRIFVLVAAPLLTYRTPYLNHFSRTSQLLQHLTC